MTGCLRTALLAHALGGAEGIVARTRGSAAPRGRTRKTARRPGARSRPARMRRGMGTRTGGAGMLATGMTRCMGLRGVRRRSVRKRSMRPLGTRSAVSGGRLGGRDRRTGGRGRTGRAGARCGTGAGRRAGDRAGLRGGRLGRHTGLARGAQVTGRGCITVVRGRTRCRRAPGCLGLAVVLGLLAVLTGCLGVTGDLGRLGAGLLVTCCMPGARGGCCAPARLRAGNGPGAGRLGAIALVRALLGLHPVGHPADDRGFNG